MENNKPVMKVFCKRDFLNLQPKYKFTVSSEKDRILKAKTGDVIVLQTQFRNGYHMIDNSWILNKETPPELFMELMFGGKSNE